MSGLSFINLQVKLSVKYVNKMLHQCDVLRHCGITLQSCKLLHLMDHSIFLFATLEHCMKGK